MPLARCPKCGRTFPNTLRECPGCGYSPFARLTPPASTAPDQSAPQQEAPSQAPRDPAARPDASRVPSGQPGAPGGAQVEFPELPDESDDEEEEIPRRRLPLIIAIIAVLVLAVLAAVFLLSRGKSDPEPEREPAPEYCADGEHVWKDASCTEPKTCTICGKTEGDPLGHDFADNVCTRCGAFDRMFVFSDLACARRGGSVVFSGVIRNYAPIAAKELHVRLRLFDKDKNPVTVYETYIFEEDAVPPLNTAQWRFAFDDSAFVWKYWSISILGYTPG